MKPMWTVGTSITYPKALLLSLRGGEAKAASFDVGDAILEVAITPGQFMEINEYATHDDVVYFDLEVTLGDVSRVHVSPHDG